jgi:hypothetical protein
MLLLIQLHHQAINLFFRLDRFTTTLFRMASLYQSAPRADAPCSLASTTPTITAATSFYAHPRPSPQEALDGTAPIAALTTA